MSESITQLARTAAEKVHTWECAGHFDPRTDAVDQITAIIEQVFADSDLNEVIDQVVEEQASEVTSGAFNQGFIRGYEAAKEDAERALWKLKGGFTASLDVADVLVPDKDGPWMLPSMAVEAIRALVPAQPSEKE